MFAASRRLPRVKWGTSSRATSTGWGSWWSTSTASRDRARERRCGRTFSRGHERHEDRCETPRVVAIAGDRARLPRRKEEGHGSDSGRHPEAGYDAVGDRRYDTDGSWEDQDQPSHGRTRYL